jgi:hypothetical protein
MKASECWCHSAKHAESATTGSPTKGPHTLAVGGHETDHSWALPFC